MKPVIVLVCLIAVVLAIPVQAEQKTTRMYKCVDAAGKVYYSDKMSPDCAKGSELNRQGVVMPKKKETAVRQPSKAGPDIGDTKESKDQARRDHALLATYTSEDEIDAARDRSLVLPAQGIKTVEIKLKRANQQLTDLKKQADALAAQKKLPPVRLREDIDATEKQVSTLESDLAQRKAQVDSIRVKFEADKQRFSELKSAGKASQ